MVLTNDGSGRGKGMEGGKGRKKDWKCSSFPSCSHRKHRQKNDSVSIPEWEIEGMDRAEYE